MPSFKQFTHANTPYKTFLLHAIRREITKVNQELARDFLILPVFTLGYSAYVASTVTLKTKSRLSQLLRDVDKAQTDSEAKELINTLESQCSQLPISQGADLFTSLANIAAKVRKYSEYAKEIHEDDSSKTVSLNAYANLGK